MSIFYLKTLRDLAQGHCSTDSANERVLGMCVHLALLRTASHLAHVCADLALLQNGNEPPDNKFIF